MPDLAGHIARIAKDETLVQRDEANTSQTAVLPVLNAMGWEYWNTSEVVPQFRVGGGKVDYCLRDAERDRNLALIEVKRTGSDLSGESEQRQLTGYAYTAGAPLACLTDGRIWRLYLTEGAMEWERREFCKIEFRQNATAAEADLDRFLSREASFNGHAVRAARAELESRERERKVRAALPEVWKRLITQPADPHGEMLHDLLAEAVEKNTGYRPEREMVQQFLLGRLRQEIPTPLASTPSGQQGAPQRQERATRRRRGPARTIRAFMLDGRRYTARNWRDMLIQVCNLLVTEDEARFADRVTSGRNAAYFSYSSTGLRESERLGNGMFVEINLNSGQIESLARDTIIAVRGPQGADSFRIDTAG